MATVFIDALTIENFGPFYGKYEFTFSDLDGRCGILIGGKNGAGKTHLLRALYLAAVGESGRVDLAKMDRDSDATKFNFDKSLNRRAQSEGINVASLSITISQRDDRSDTSRRVRLCREIRFRPNTPPAWSSYADRLDGSGHVTEDKQIEKLRDGFLPRHLARFFFFDAERSQNINLKQEDIVEGVSRILGLWSYSELENDLRNLIGSKIPRTFNSGGARDEADKLAELNSLISRNEKVLKNAQKQQQQLETELGEVESELSAVEDELKSLGAVDPEALQKIQEQRVEIARRKGELEEQLKTSWEQPLPIALLGTFKKELEELLLREERRRDWEGRKATVEPKIPQIKLDVFENVEDEYTLRDDLYAYYSNRLEHALHSLFNPPPEGMSVEIPFLTDRNDTSAQIRAILGSGAASISNLAQRAKEIDGLDAELRELDSRIKQFSQSRTSIERGEELHQKRGSLIRDRDTHKKQLEELEIEIQNIEHQLTELRGQEKVQEVAAMKAEQGQTLITIASRYRETTTRIKELAAVQLRDQISEHVGELWTQIVDRQHEFSGLEFDSHWGCHLRRKNGDTLQWDEINPSAGQRQVRMLAFYEALRRLARLVPPLVVDTPLGRLDNEVRDSVVNKLYLSGHQSLILATNSEIDPDGRLFNGIKGRLARVYTLEPHGDKDSIDYHVQVRGDYFGREL